jgi:sugar phosphate isomerase/epimerase
MKRLSAIIIPVWVLFLASACNSNPASTPASVDSTAVKADSSTGSTAGFKLGVQIWTFTKFTMLEGLDKIDSTGIKFMEANPGQKLGGSLPGNFDTKMTADTRAKLKDILKKKGIQIVAMGVYTPKNREEWIKTFDLAKEFGLSYITSEPHKDQWDLADSLAGVYGIPVAIHDHPKPNAYWSPDSVLAATVGHPHIGSCADVGHWARNGLNPVECLKKLEGHVIGVHLKDIVKFNDTDAADTLVGKGVIDFPAVLAELKRQNFHGMLSIEHESNWYNSVPDVIATKNYYDSLIQKLQ